MKKSNLLFFIIYTFGIATTFYLTNIFLKTNFYQNGESFMKGYGHLLDENKPKGIIFVLTLNFFVSYFISSILYNLIEIVNYKALDKILLVLGFTILFCTLIYVFFQLNNSYINTNRIVEITITWTSRLFGILIGSMAHKKITMIINK